MKILYKLSNAANKKVCIANDSINRKRARTCETHARAHTSYVTRYAHTATSLHGRA